MDQTDANESRPSSIETDQSPSTAKMPLRDARSGKPGSSGSSSARDEFWSDEAKRAGTGADPAEVDRADEVDKDLEGDW